MAYESDEKIHLDGKMQEKNLDESPIDLLEKIKKSGRNWSDLCKQYGVDNPDPPWKITLEATCDGLDEYACALPGVERRWEEDRLRQTHYSNVPFPECQLLALAHSMIRRGLLNEQELSERMSDVGKKLNMVEDYS